jgi:hypothetical protein
MTTYTDVVKSRFDTTLYTEYLISEYGQALTYGALGGVYNSAIKHAKVLAKLLDTTVEKLIAHVQHEVRLNAE